jgi:DNA (cytosine-5)-methyltransferase 1
MPNDAIEYTYSNARLDEMKKGYIKKQNQKDNSIMSTLKTNPQQIGVCVDEPFTVASRGRNPDNPSDRTTGAPTEQRLEPRFDGCTNTLTSVQKDNYVAIKTANKQGYDLATDGDGVDLAYPDSKTRRGRVGHGVSKTLPTSDSQGVMDGYRIRKLTPLECWRLMGFDDTDFYKAEKVNSNTQLYKQAGNSIVVNVLEAILRELLGSWG